MKKLIVTILKFLPVAIGIYLVILFAWGSVMPLYLRKNLNYRIGAYGHMHSRVRDVKVAENVDVLILGSSHAYRGFDTRIFEQHGIRAFNLGSSSQTPVQTLMLLRNYLNRLSPKLVILEVYPETFKFDGVESSLDIVANEQIDWNVFRMVLTVNHIKTWNSFFYGWFRQIAGFDKDFVQPVYENQGRYIQGGGFLEQDMGYFRHMVHPVSHWEINSKQSHSFNKVLELLENKKTPFILVQAPFTSSLYRSKTNNEMMDSIFLSKGNYINFNGKLPLNDSLHFYDADHMNQDGVKIFNEAFLQWLKQQPDTVTHLQHISQKPKS